VIRLQGAEQDDLGDATDWERVEALSDDDIRRAMAGDPDAPPELDEAFWRNVQMLDPRHGKTTITMRVDDDVLVYFKGGGSGYQSRMNAVLRAYVYARRERPG
jgi:uncharacterized protein (DUF4415 family)